MITLTEADIEKVARAWASIDGKTEAFEACKADPKREETEGRYHGYMEDARELMKAEKRLAKLKAKRRKK